MQQFSLYHSAEGLLYKTTCQLVEKSYYSSLKIVILAPDIEVQESLNNLIWTYSRKQFIPHGSKHDPLPEKQPVYLTNELENPNKAQILIIISPSNIEEILSKKEYVNQFQRIIIVYEGLDNFDVLINKISVIITTSPIIECYQQNPIGSWRKVVISG